MIRFRIKQMARGLVFIILIQISSIYTAHALENIKVINIRPAQFSGRQIDKENGFLHACKNWHLNKQQIIQIFYLSKETTYIGLTNFDFMPCEINGKLKLKDKIMTFSINAGSFFKIWNKGDDSIYYACAKKECAKFFP